MHLKFSAWGLLLYAAMAVDLAAVALWLLGRRRAARAVYGSSAVLLASLFLWRWAAAGHVPLRTLFDVFVALACLLPPVTWLCRRLLGVGAEALDALLAAVILVPAGFVFEADPGVLPPILQSPLFVPHVAAYMLAYVLTAKAAFQAARTLLGRGDPGEHGAATRHLLYAALPPMTAGLLLGSVWGKMAWGHWWNWDPKELWSLASWLVLVASLHLPLPAGPRRDRVQAAMVLCGAALVVITLVWANLSRAFQGLHSYAT